MIAIQSINGDYARQTVESILPILRVKNSNGIIDIEIGKPYAPYKTVWTDKKYDANAYGTQLINSMVPGNDFDFPKSVWNVYECLYATTKDNPNAVILDFFCRFRHNWSCCSIAE
jgi:adenine-specific DNA-methyltransferase